MISAPNGPGSGLISKFWVMGIHCVHLASLKCVAPESKEAIRRCIYERHARPRSERSNVVWTVFGRHHLDDIATHNSHALNGMQQGDRLIKFDRYIYRHPCQHLFDLLDHFG
jgi:hypothetical protein